MATGKQGAEESVVEDLQARGVKGVLLQMAKNGQILELKCEMPTCYCPKGRRHFDPWPSPPHVPGHDWSPNADHHPRLRMDGGPLRPWNVRLAHVFCNNTDFGWRKRIRQMLEDDPTLSFDKIAEALNRKKDKHVPPGAKVWTAKLVRKAYVS
jgi:hypothetical protein